MVKETARPAPASGLYANTDPRCPKRSSRPASAPLVQTLIIVFLQKVFERGAAAGGFGQLNVQLERRQDAHDLSDPKFGHTAVLKGVDGGATNLGAVRQCGLSELQRLSLLCDAFAESGKVYHCLI